MSRWELLNREEKEIVWHYVVLLEKRFAIGRNIRGVNERRVATMLYPIYRILGVSNVIELALFVGKNYEQVEMDAVAFGFEMPKELTAAK